jgi:hypothetical protein
MKLDINPAVVTYSGYQNVNPALNNGTLSVNYNNGSVYISWFSTSPATLSNGSILLALNFTGMTGTGTMTWDLQTPGACEFSNITGALILSSWISSTATVFQLPSVTMQPVSRTIGIGSSTTFSVTAAGTGLAYQWQLSTDGGTNWTDLSDGGNYSNVNTNTLGVSNAQLSMSGFRYRCRVSGTCPPPVYSSVALLMVTYNVINTCQSVSGCPGEIVVPVNVTAFTGVGAFSMKLNINTSILSFIRYQNPDNELGNGYLSVNANGNSVYISWFSTTATTIPNGATLLELVFNGVTGASTLTWDTQATGYCEYSDINGNIMVSTWNNGNATIYQVPSIVTHPVDRTIYAGSNTTFSCSGAGTSIAYQWQLSTDNGLNWYNLADGGVYSGVTTATMTITSALYSMNGYKYRCKVSGTCNPAAYTNASLLTVTPAAITTTAAGITNSCTRNIQVPVTVTNCNNIGSITLALQYDTTKLSFEYYDRVHEELTPGMLSVNRFLNKIYLSWASTNAANVGSDTLIRFWFKAGDGISTTLSWDVQSPGICEYSDMTGLIITDFYNNGNISITANALLANAGTDVSISPGDTIQLSGTAAGGTAPFSYSWSPVSWLDNPAIATPKSSPPHPVTYILTVTDNTNCKASDAVKVTPMYNLPAVITDTMTFISYLSATGGGSITSNGGSEILARGVCWTTGVPPTLTDSHTEDGTGTGAFVSQLTGLAPGVTYNVRAYATNITGTAYGETVIFSTIDPPVNQPPNIDPVPDPEPITEDAGIQTITLTGIDDGTPELPQNINITAVSSNNSIIPHPAVNYISGDPTGNLNYTPVTNASGSAVITVTLTDDGGTLEGGDNTTVISFLVMVLPVNDPPVANAGPDQARTAGQTVTLNGSASADIEGDPLTYAWIAPDGIELNDSTLAQPGFTTNPSCSGQTLVFGLIVNDGNLDSSVDQVSITLNPTPPDITVQPVNLPEVLVSGTSSNKSFKIKNEGTCNLTFTLTDQAAWLSVNPTNGIVLPGDSVAITAMFNAAGLNAGNYNAAITVSSNDPDESPVYIAAPLIVYSPVSVQASATPSSYCIGGSTQLNVSVTGGSGTYSYLWSSSPPGFTSSIRNPQVDPTVTTSYFVNVTDGYSSASSSVLLTVYDDESPAPVSSMLPADSAVNILLPVSFSWAPAANATSYDLYIWPASENMPSNPTVSDLFQIAYLMNQGLSYGQTYKWRVVSKNPCFETQGPVKVFSMKNLPDLQVQNVFAPSTAFSEQVIQVTWQIRNDGDGNSGSQGWYDAVYLSNDAVLNSESDLFWGNFSNVSYLEPGQNYERIQSFTLPFGIAGFYYVIIQSDRFNTLQEENNNNNTGYNTEAMLVQLTPPPDLQVTSIISPENTFSGQQVNISWEVTNEGPGATSSSSWNDRVYLSQDTIFNPASATVLGTYAHSGGLAPDISYMQSKTVTIPGDIFGTYYFHVATDLNNQVYEHAFENNNHSRSIPLNIILTPPPDLVVTSMEIPSEASNRQSISVEWNVLNQGGTQPVSGDWDDIIYLSTDPDYNLSGAVEAGSYYNDEMLMPDSSYNASVSINIPNTLNGHYYVYIKADGNNQVNEHSFEGNNLLRSDTTLLITSPDLWVYDLLVPAADSTGQPVTISWKVMNNGPGTIYNSGWTDKVFVSYSPVFNPAAVTQIASLNYGVNLYPEEFVSKQVVTALPNNFPGPYYIYVYTDHYNSVFENSTDSNNTIRSENQVVVKRPDLVVSSVNMPEIDSTGMPFIVSWQVQNVGDANLTGGNLKDRIYFSRSPVFHQDSVSPAGELSYTLNLPENATTSRQKTVSLPENEQGPFFVYVVTDVNNTVFENGHENNNTGRSDQAIELYRPDLVITDLACPASANSGSMVTIQWVLKNQGMIDLTGESWTDSLYLCPTINFRYTNAIPLFKKEMSVTIVDGQEMVFSQPVLIPNGLSGTWFVFGKTDCFDSVFEDNGEANNLCAPAVIQLALPPWADLHVTLLQVPGSIMLGETFTVTMEVKNSGTAVAAAPWKDKLYLSLLPAWSSENSVFITEISRTEALPPGSSVYLEVPLSLSLTHPAGTYYFHLIADAADEVYEHTAENNNIQGTAAVELVYPLDLALTGLTALDSVGSGGLMEITWTVENQCGNPTLVNSWSDGIYFSGDTLWNPSEDLLVVQWSVNGPLNPGASYCKTKTFNLPNGISGSFYLLMVNDLAGVNDDIDFSDNTRVYLDSLDNPGIIEITLTDPPDLVISEFSAPTTAIAGKTLPLEWTVVNNGTGATGPVTWYDKIYLSTDFEINNNDILLGNQASGVGLEPGEEYNMSIQPLLPGNISGNYILIAKTDASGAVYEHTGESNNLVTSVLQVSLQQPCDLSAGDVAGPAGATAGGEITVTWEIYNTGDNPAQGSNKDILYLSRDTIWDISDELLGQKTYNLNLSPGDSIVQNHTAKVTSAMAEDYYVIVRTDALNLFNEINEDNNTASAEDAISMEVTELTLDELFADTLANQAEQFYRLDIPYDLREQTLLFTLTGDSVAGANEVYIRFEGMPSRSVHDYSHSYPYQGNQQVLVPTLEGGIYYILVHGNTTAGAEQEITLLAEIVEFDILEVNEDRGGTTGEITVLMKGAQFFDGMEVFLKKGDTTIPAKDFSYLDGSSGYVTFNLSGADTGYYDVMAYHFEGDTALFENGFRIVEGGESVLSLNLDYPSSTRPGNVIAITIQFGNSGNNNVPNPARALISLGGAPLAKILADLHYRFEDLYLEFSEPGGPPGILRPGAVSGITIYTLAIDEIDLLMVEIP